MRVQVAKRAIPLAISTMFCGMFEKCFTLDRWHKTNVRNDTHFSHVLGDQVGSITRKVAHELADQFTRTIGMKSLTLWRISRAGFSSTSCQPSLVFCSSLTSISAMGWAMAL